MTQDLKPIITDPNGAAALVAYAQQLGTDLKNAGLNTSQIRALFGEVRQIQAQWSMGDKQTEQARRRLILLKPKMAYRAQRASERASERASGRAVRQLVDVLTPALDLVVNERNAEKQTQNFGHFVDFFEAILAYHKAAGGN